MNVQAVHAVIHTQEQVGEIIHEARVIADKLSMGNHEWELIFNKAADLLGQRATTFIAPQQVPFDLMALKANSG